MTAGNFACYVSVTINVDIGVIQVKPRLESSHFDGCANSSPARNAEKVYKLNSVVGFSAESISRYYECDAS